MKNFHLVLHHSKLPVFCQNPPLSGTASQHYPLLFNRLKANRRKSKLQFITSMNLHSSSTRKPRNSKGPFTNLKNRKANCLPTRREPRNSHDFFRGWKLSECHSAL